jgi:hypothetical protein
MDEQRLESRNYTYQVCQSSELDSDTCRELPRVAHAASQETTGLALRLGLRWRREGIKRLVVGSQSIGGRSLGQLGFDPMTTKKTKTLDGHPCSKEGRVNRLLPVRAFETQISTSCLALLDGYHAIAAIATLCPWFQNP